MYKSLDISNALSSSNDKDKLFAVLCLKHLKTIHISSIYIHTQMSRDIHKTKEKRQ